MENSSDQILSPVFNKNDKSFVHNLNNFIEEELELLENGPKNNNVLLKEKYLIYKQAFGKVVSYVQVYKSLLSNIKKEYEFCINELETNQLDEEKSQEEIIRLEGSTETLYNLENRKKELEKKLDQTREENIRLERNLDKLIEENKKYRPNESDNLLSGKHFMTQDQFAFFKEKSQLAMDTRPLGPIKGLSLERSTDLNYLTNLLNELESKIALIQTTKSKKYANKLHKKELEKRIFESMSVRDSAQDESVKLKNNMFLYKFAINLAKEYYKGNTRYSSIQDALSRGLIESYLSRQKSKTLDNEDNNTLDDLKLESDSEFILDYLEKFNDLFDSEKYIEAAYFAAASPKNILRNIETLLKFKKVSNENDYEEDDDPLLVYCMSVIDSINDENSKPNIDMSIESIRIILKFNKLDFLTRLVAQRRITFSYNSAKLIEEYAFFKPKKSKNLYELVLFMYKDIKAPFEAAICMAKLGRLSAMMDFIKIHYKSATEQSDIYFKILEQCPDIELANDIMDNSISENNKTPIDKIVSILLDSDHPENGLKFLKVQIQKNSKNNDENLKKLKSSYETLIKFSFLTCEDDEFTKSLAQESRDQLHNIYINTKLNEKSVNHSKPNERIITRRNSKEFRRSPKGSIAEDQEEELKETMHDHVDSKALIKNAQKSMINLNSTLVEEDEETED